MNTTRQSIQSIVPEQLHNTTRLVNAGKYADALKVIRTAKNSHPRNIYIIALEKQVERLSILSQSGRLTRQMKDEILGSLPGLVDRATFEIEDHDLPPRAPAAPTPTPRPPAIVNEKPAKDPVANNLKQQYFDQAERFITRGAYDNAMAEIRRIQMIDPENELAKEIEEKILKLAEKRLKGPSAPLQQDVPIDVSKHLLNHRADEDDLDRSFGQRMPGFAGTQRDIVFEEPVEKEYVPARPPIFFVAFILILFAAAAGAYYYLSSSPDPQQNTIDQEVSSPSESFKFLGKEEKPEIKSETPPRVDSGTSIQSSAQSGEMLEVATPQVRPLETDPVVSGPPDIKQRANEEKSANPPQKPLPTEIKTKEPTPTISSIETAQKPSPQPVSVQPVNTSPSAQTSNEEAVSFAKFEVAPRVVQLQEPTYPDSARKAGLSGQVIIHVQLDTQGKPISARVFKSSNSVFETPSIVAALKSSYSPAQTANGPVIAWISVPFLFRPQ